MFGTSKPLDQQVFPGVSRNNREPLCGRPDSVSGESGPGSGSRREDVSGERMGIKFRFRRTKCTGSYRDKPLVEVRWTTEEGDYCLDDLIAGDLERAFAPRQALGGNGNGTGNPKLGAPFSKAPAVHRTVVHVDLTAPHDLDNAAAIRRVSVRARPEPSLDSDAPPEILNKIV